MDQFSIYFILIEEFYPVAVEVPMIDIQFIRMWQIRIGEYLLRQFVIRIRVVECMLRESGIGKHLRKLIFRESPHITVLRIALDSTEECRDMIFSAACPVLKPELVLDRDDQPATLCQMLPDNVQKLRIWVFAVNIAACIFEYADQCDHVIFPV